MPLRITSTKTHLVSTAARVIAGHWSVVTCSPCHGRYSSLIWGEMQQVSGCNPNSLYPYASLHRTKEFSEAGDLDYCPECERAVVTAAARIEADYRAKMRVPISLRNTEVRKVAVTTQGARVHVIRTLSEHNQAAVLLHEDPTGRLGDDPEAERLHIEIRRSPEVVDREEVMVLQDG